MNGLFHAAIAAPFMALIYFIPWTILIVYLYRWKK